MDVGGTQKVDYSTKVAVTIVGLSLVAVSCASGLSAGARAEALGMCVEYQQRMAMAGHGSDEALCTSAVGVADAEGCDLDTTIRYIAASLDTRPYRIRHQEVWFGFGPNEDPSVVLRDC
jgi:hypothetical protein